MSCCCCYLCSRFFSIGAGFQMALWKVNCVKIVQCASTLVVNKIRQPQSNKQTDKHHAPDTLQTKVFISKHYHSLKAVSVIFSDSAVMVCPFQTCCLKKFKYMFFVKPPSVPDHPHMWSELHSQTTYLLRIEKSIQSSQKIKNINKM